MTDPAPETVVVGLVGRIGAGKSTVARVLAADFGAEVVDADAIAHAVLDEPATRDAVAARFGAGVLRADGRVDRSALAAIVFGLGDEAGEALADLEGLVHPRVRERIEGVLAGEPAATPTPVGRRVIVLDVPLLMQAGWDDLCQRLIHVTCDEVIRRARLAARGWTAAHQARREAAWEQGFRLPPPAKTTCVDASRDVAYIRNQIAAAWPLVTGA